jgi:hypothetical protein
MNKVAEFLIEMASDLRSSSPELVAIGLLKQAGMAEDEARLAVAQDSMEKKACAELTYRGVDAEEAVKLVKAANVNVKDLTGVQFETEEERLAGLLEKAASYIESQAAYIADLEKTASEVKVVERVVEVQVQEPEMPESFNKVASVCAMTFEDIEALKALPEETMSKIAAAVDEPWELGKAAGVARPVTDPLTEFLLS